ncbi:MAG: hypothetical protein IIB61_09885 [Planctomycetes bacterium]|nr:hypothetical protein [Planctomycetota bacterium]
MSRIVERVCHRIRTTVRRPLAYELPCPAARVATNGSQTAANNPATINDR